MFDNAKKFCKVFTDEIVDTFPPYCLLAGAVESALGIVPVFPITGTILTTMCATQYVISKKRGS